MWWTWRVAPPLVVSYLKVKNDTAITSVFAEDKTVHRPALLLKHILWFLPPKLTQNLFIHFHDEMTQISFLSTLPNRYQIFLYFWDWIILSVRLSSYAGCGKLEQERSVWYAQGFFLGSSQLLAKFFTRWVWAPIFGGIQSSRSKCPVVFRGPAEQGADFFRDLKTGATSGTAKMFCVFWA